MTGQHRAQPPGVLAELSKLEAAAYLEAMKEAHERAKAVYQEWLDELEQERADARRAFERKFFEVP